MRIIHCFLLSIYIPVTCIFANIFQLLNCRHGPFTLDPFASNITKKVTKFYSRIWCQGSQGVDAFAYSWQNEVCWLVPPPKLIPRTIKHMRQCKARGILIVPKWQSAIFWPIIHDGSEWRNGISLLLEYVKPKNFFIKAAGGNNLFNENAFTSNVLVLNVNFE